MMVATTSVLGKYNFPSTRTCNTSRNDVCVFPTLPRFLDQDVSFCKKAFGVPLSSPEAQKTTTEAGRESFNNDLDMEAVAAEELKHRSHLEREMANEELHGVAQSTFDLETKTPELGETSLVLLPLELDRISKAKKRAYVKAVFLKPKLATDRAFQLMFLRATLFDVPAAAQRICRFFQEKLDLFGEDKLVTKITLADLTQDDIDSVLTTGAGHILPQRDRSGRLVFFADYQYIDYRHWKNINRMSYYLAMTELEEDDSIQANGIVEVFQFSGALNRQQLVTEHLTKGLKGVMCLPIRFAGIHFCYDNPALKPILSLAQMAFGASNRLRLRPHCGSVLEIMYELMSFGIHVPQPILERDEGVKKELVESYLLKRTKIEYDAAQIADSTTGINSSTIDSPGNSNDVLLGRGKPFQQYSGNLRMNELVDAYLEQYRACKEKAAKSMIPMKIVDQIHEKGGQFLERKDDCWKIVTDEKIMRNKVSQAFRVRNRPTAKKATAASENCDDEQDEEDATKRTRLG